jgi:hyperosmotically inducible protein
MSFRKTVMIASLAGVLGWGGGCQSNTKSADVKAPIEQSLEQAGLKDVSVSQDREKGVVTLSGTVASDDQRSQAESIARSLASGQVVANQNGVRPPGSESVAKNVDSALDDAIDKNVKAELIERRWDKDIRYDVKNGVVTLKGSVNSQARRSDVEKTVSGTPNVRQVVNELEVKGQKASATPRS